MSFEVNKAFVNHYRNNVLMLAQQEGSRLLGTVMQEAAQGLTHFFEQIGPTQMIERTTRHADSPQVDTPHDRRQATLKTYWWGDLVDNPDKVRMLIDPTSPYARNAGMALGRQIDRTILTALTGEAFTLGGNEEVPTAGPVDLTTDGGLVIGAGGNDPLTVDTLIAARNALRKGNVDLDMEMPCIACSSEAISDLLKDNNITSHDYNTVRALVNGEVDTYMGFKFIHTEEVLRGQFGDPQSHATCPVWVRSGAALAIDNTTGRSRIEERADKGFSTYVFNEMNLGATRLEGVKVVAIQVDETADPTP